MSGATDDRILDAAAAVLAERGYAAATTRAIAERAGVNEVTLFRRFENKAGILRALGERFTETQAGFAAPSMPDPADTFGTVDALARMEIANAVRDGGLAIRLAIDAQHVPEVAELMGDGPSRNLRGLADYLRTRQVAGDIRDDVDPALLAEALFALTSTLVMSRQLLGHAGRPEELGSEERMRQIVSLLWSGMRKEPR